MLHAQDLGDLSYGTVWTPNSIGNFSLVVTIDGVTLEDVYRIEVKEANIPPPKKMLKKNQPANKLRKFMTKNSAGLRMRSHPTLQSEQVGVLKMGGIISFIDEVLFAIVLIDILRPVINILILSSKCGDLKYSWKMMTAYGCAYQQNPYGNIANLDGIHLKHGACNTINILARHYCIQSSNQHHRN